MAVNDDITIAKGAFTVPLSTINVTENFKNILKVIPGVVAPDVQATGVKLLTVVDLLRITHTLVIEAHITKTSAKTALQVKSDLKSIFNGANVSSAPVILTYEDESVNVFIEDLVIKKVNNDNVVATGYGDTNAIEYHVSMTVVEGKLVGT